MRKLYSISELFRGGDSGYGIPKELDMFIDGVFEDPLLVAMGAEALGRVFDVDGGSDSVAVHSFGSEERHIGGSRAHLRDGDHVVNFPVRSFDGPIGVGVQG